MISSLRWFLLLAIVALLAPVSSSPVQAARDDIVGATAVRGDALLRVGRNWMRLYGVYIPPTSRQCRTFLQPR